MPMDQKELRNPFDLRLIMQVMYKLLQDDLSSCTGKISKI